MERNEKLLFVYLLPALLTPLPLMPFTNEEITCFTIEAAKSANKAPRNPPSCFFISCFTVSVIPSINTPESFHDFMILIIAFISSYGINKLPSLFPLIFLSNLFIAFEAKLLTIQATCLQLKE